jgi:bloom syndrome protein
MATAESEKLANDLRKRKLSAAHYHGKMAADHRMTAQARWSSGKVSIMVATLAFGMGIDKADVRFVIHQTFPKSTESLYQEQGRAGRDGAQSHCMIMYSKRDEARITNLVTGGQQTRDVLAEQLALLKTIREYCEDNFQCRRARLLNYFGEEYDPRREKVGPAGCCDVCVRGKVPTRMVDYSEVGADLVDMVRALSVKRNKAPFPAAGYLTELYLGSKSKKITDVGDDTLPHYGAGKLTLTGDKRTLIKRILTLLTDQQVLKMHTRKLPRAGPVPSINYYELGPQASRPVKIAFEEQAAGRELEHSPGESPASKGIVQRGPPAKAVVTVSDSDSDLLSSD